MTTKRKIILGFTAMIVLMAALAFFGNRGLQAASDNFNEYRRLARFNVLTSDTVSEMSSAISYIFQFTTTDEEKYLDEANRLLQVATDHTLEAEKLVLDQSRIDILVKVRGALTELKESAAALNTSLQALMDQYSSSVKPTAGKMSAALWDLQLSTLETGNLSAIRIAATAMNQLGNAITIVTGLSQSRFLEEFPDGVDVLDAMKSSLDTLAPLLMTNKEKDILNGLLQDYAAFRAGVIAIQDNCVLMQTNLEKIDEIGDVIDTTLVQLSSTVNDEMLGQGTKTLNNNSSAQKLMMGISAGGILAGIILAALAIFGLVRVLKELGVFAGAIASGNFKYQVRVREKGEVGQMVSAMQQIPDALNDILLEYQNLERQVEDGSLLAKGDAAKFSGDFSTLVKGTNSVLDRFITVLESIPSPVVMLDKELKAAYLNAKARELAGNDYRNKSCFQLFAREDFDTDMCALKQAISTKHSASGETRAHPQGTDMDISYTAIPMYTKEGSLASVLQLITDLTAIKQTQRTIMHVASQAAEVSNRVAAASEQLSAQVEQVSRGAEVQRTRVESTASAMTEMNATVLEVARNASQASEQSELTRGKADNGAGLVKQVVQAINEVNKVATTMHGNMQELGKQAESIGGVMNVISDIADQTNLLALNAAIEAARAGEAGRGFAVVADEVRKLAEKTMTATNEVGSNITAIQHSARINIDAMEDASRAVGEATELAHSSGDALTEIVNLASSNSSVVASIATAAEEQSATSEEISTAINEINQIVGETSEGMVQASSAVQELSQMAQELNNIMGQLK